jgi:hypothetical protein
MQGKNINCPGGEDGFPARWKIIAEDDCLKTN